MVKTEYVEPINYFHPINVTVDTFHSVVMDHGEFSFFVENIHNFKLAIILNFEGARGSFPAVPIKGF